jgi:large subunit ribosomal protein L23
MIMNSRILKKSLVTEKNAHAEARGVYVFQVPSSVNKIQVEQEINRLYGVQVEKVRIVNVIKKTRKIGRERVMTKRPAHKKAFVYLKDTTKPLDIVSFK